MRSTYDLNLFDVDVAMFWGNRGYLEWALGGGAAADGDAGGADAGFVVWTAYMDDANATRGAPVWESTPVHQEACGSAGGVVAR